MGMPVLAGSHAWGGGEVVVGPSVRSPGKVVATFVQRPVFNTAWGIGAIVKC